MADFLNASASGEPAVSDRCRRKPTGPLHLEGGPPSPSFCFGGSQGGGEATPAHKLGLTFGGVCVGSLNIPSL